MQRVTRWKMVFSACLAAMLLAGAAPGEDRKPAAKALDRHTLDESIYQNLRGIIDHGANLYNQGDWNGCYRLWEGALMNLKPLLDHRPKLQEAIDSGLANARQDAMLWHRAWVLRPVLDKVRADIDADYPHRKKSPKGSPVAQPEPKSKTMWDRLGGEAGVTRIIDDFVNLTAKDPKVDFFRHNKVKLDAEHVVQMKRQFVELISQATGGPLKYTGPDMKKVHKDMGITNEQFDAAAANLKKALEKSKVAPEDRKKILDAVESYRKEIVQPKKPEDKKPEKKEPIKKKPAEKKPEDKKPEDKKPTEKKPAEKEPAASVNVTGKVMCKGKPAGGAQIGLVSEDGKVVRAPVGADGNYKLAVKPGAYRVTFSAAAKRALPAAYADAKTTPLMLKVVEGTRSYDFNLQ